MSEKATPAVTRRRETTRQRLLDAAARVFAETGLDAASVEVISERAGFTRGAFYSNFDSKEQLFLELSARTAESQIAAVRERVAQLESAGGAGDPAELVTEVLAVAGSDRTDVLLLSEIRVHSLRVPELATAFLAQEQEMLASVAQIVADIAQARDMTLRVSAETAARIFLTTWSATTERAVMAGLDDGAMRAELGEVLGEVAAMLLGDD